MIACVGSSRRPGGAGALNHPHIWLSTTLDRHDGVPVYRHRASRGRDASGRLAGGADFRRARFRITRSRSPRAPAAAHERNRPPGPEAREPLPDHRRPNKILDFGLAKLTQAGRRARATQTSAADGLAGTRSRAPSWARSGYMSPEQVRGTSPPTRGPTSSRSGAGLYQRTLSGSARLLAAPRSPPATMSAILNAEDPPELSATAARNVPPGLERVVRHCLEKKPRGAVPLGARSRLRSRVGFRTPWANSRPPPRLAGSCAPLRCSAQPPFSLARVSTGWSAITPGRKAVTFRRITFRRGDVAAARFTPDGDNVVYSAAFDGNPTEVYLTRRDGHDARPLGHAGHAVGRRLAYGRARGRPRRRAA